MADEELTYRHTYGDICEEDRKRLENLEEITGRCRKALHDLMHFITKNNGAGVSPRGAAMLQDAISTTFNVEYYYKSTMLDALRTKSGSVKSEKP